MYVNSVPPLPLAESISSLFICTGLWKKRGHSYLHLPDSCTLDRDVSTAIIAHSALDPDRASGGLIRYMKPQIVINQALKNCMQLVSPDLSCSLRRFLVA
ncbi:hypothetical protein KIL84_002937 [Mauremys mutica]|uniref:Uncharacterized protein n=1 Tax=Mauremys mutica TaxID=74926 RepID=A0A9D3WNN9_9SAUR|nr:hypothetical protein KIL84_002937 [Mauremys mutica]